MYKILMIRVEKSLSKLFSIMEFMPVVACLLLAHLCCTGANLDVNYNGLRLSLFKCQNSSFFIEDSTDARLLAEYLNDAIGGSDSEQVASVDLWHPEHVCDENAETRNVTTDIISFAESWRNELANDTTTYFLYSSSLDEFNLFELYKDADVQDDDDVDQVDLTEGHRGHMSTEEEYVADEPTKDEQEELEELEDVSDYHNYHGPPIKGCIIRLKNHNRNASTGFSFTSFDDAKNVYGRYTSDEEYCGKYVDQLKTKNKAYGPFYGLPVIYVPGIISSQLVAHRKDQSNPKSWKSKLVWLGWEEVVLSWGSLGDWLRMKINEDGTSSSHEELYIDVANWGHPDSVDSFETPRFHSLTRFLKSLGYKAGVSLRAAPYDFRLAPDESDIFMGKFKRLIETTYKMNYNKKIVLLGHSMGNLFTLYFLNRQSQEWKDKYIHSLVSIAAPWYGSTDAIKFFIRGQLNYEILRPLESYLKSIASTWKSLLYLLPNELLYDETFPIIRTPSKNYTVMDYEQLLRDIKRQDAVAAYHRVKNLTKSMIPPGVEVHCLYSYYGTRKMGDYYYEFPTDASFPYGTMEIIHEDGDGVVNLRSAKGCLQWKEQQKQPVYEKSFYKVEHSVLLNDYDLHAYLKELLFN